METKFPTPDVALQSQTMSEAPSYLTAGRTYFGSKVVLGFSPHDAKAKNVDLTFIATYNFLSKEGMVHVKYAEILMLARCLDWEVPTQMSSSHYSPDALN
ncbi:hypothetical protein TNCV_4549431 [Trichonephila clavipes]|nr:hypothetical protein TNCV_4549431 [Trichonephila clavipes]